MTLVVSKFLEHSLLIWGISICQKEHGSFVVVFFYCDISSSHNAFSKLYLKDVCAKIFHSIDFFKFVLQSDNELLVPEMQKKLGVTFFVSDIKRVENYPDFDKYVYVIQHCLQWFIVNNYSPKWRWMVMDIYRAAKRRGKYPSLSPTLRWVIVLVYTTQAE